MFYYINITPSQMDFKELKHILNSQTHNNSSFIETVANDLNEKKLVISSSDNNVSIRTKNIINRYIRLDKAYRLKHEELKTLHQAYKQLYQKYKRNRDNFNKKECEDKMNNIYGKIKENDHQMYKNRLLIIGKIKGDKTISEPEKQYLAKKMMVVFRVPPIEPYKPIQQVIPVNKETVNVKELDNAYINKHNELMTMFKAYNKLYSKTLDYKDKLDGFKTLDVRSSISKNQMNKMLADQKYIMQTLDKMQDNLIKKDILRNDERIPTSPVVNNLNNIGIFNETIKGQINNLITRNNNNNITENARNEIHKILETNNNSERDNKIRQILLYRR